ncbi:MAG: hypothetical protein AB1523_02105 [Bacillota bacterium]
MLKVIPGKFARSDSSMSKYALLKKIEAVLYEHPLVAEAAVRYNQENVLIAFIVPLAEKFNPSEIEKFLSGYLTAEELPQVYRFVAEVPKSLSGKCPQIAEPTF